MRSRSSRPSIVRLQNPFLSGFGKETSVWATFFASAASSHRQAHLPSLVRTASLGSDAPGAGAFAIGHAMTPATVLVFMNSFMPQSAVSGGAPKACPGSDPAIPCCTSIGRSVKLACRPSSAICGPMAFIEANCSSPIGFHSWGTSACEIMKAAAMAAQRAVFFVFRDFTFICPPFVSGVCPYSIR